MGAMVSKLTLKDVDALSKLFHSLQELSNFEKPTKNQALWKQCLKEAKEELVEQVKKRESQLTFRPGRNFPLRKTSEEKQKNLQKIIIGKAEIGYRLKDSKYNQSLLQVEEEIAELVKAIDHTLYSIREPLLKFDRAHGTLLEANWRQIRDRFTIDEIMQFHTQGLVERAIDALEAIKANVEHQQQIKLPEKPAKTGGNATPTTIINIDKLGVLGNVKAESVQTGDYARHAGRNIDAPKPKKSIWGLIKKVSLILSIIVALVEAIS